MAKWFLRDRGQVLGPYTTEQILEMRDRGTVASYHEVSADRRLWKLIDDVPAFSRTGARPAPARPAAPRPAAPRAADDEPAPPDPGADRGPRASGLAGIGPQKLIIGGVAALVLFAGAILVGILVFRSKPKDTVSTAPGGAPGAAEGAITFGAQSLQEQERVLKESVGLVVSGLEVKYPDGRVWEVPAYSLESRGTALAVRFGSPLDLIPEKVPPDFALTDFGTGSGFAVSPSGHFVTNRHVVQKIKDFEDARNRKDLEVLLRATIEPRVWVFFGREQRFVAKIHYISTEYDVAVLKLERESKYYFALSETPPANIPKLKNLSSLGFPGVDRAVLTERDRADAALRANIDRGAIQLLFPERAFEFSSRGGEITNKAFLNRMRADQNESWVLQHSAQIYGGNSGGPLINKDGTVLGINTWTNEQRVGINFALTLPQLRKELDGKIPGTVWREMRE